MKKLIFVLLGIIIITKVDAQNFIWAKQMGGPSYQDEGTSIAVDDSGNVYTTGNFHGIADFDPGPGVFNLASTGLFDGDDAFISKLDAYGNFVWAKQIAGIVQSNALNLDPFGNIYLTGHYRFDTDFDPDPGTLVIRTTDGSNDAFILKLDHSANFVWVGQFLGDPVGSGDEDAKSIVTDAFGNVFITGWFNSYSVDFDPSHLTYSYLQSANGRVFIVKLDSAGNFIWAKGFGGLGGSGNAINVDSFGNVYIAGFFTDIADFDPDSNSVFNLVSAGGNDVFIAKLDASGSLVWAKQVGGSEFDNVGSLAVDDFGNINILGTFKDTADFDPGPGISNLISTGSYDAFILQLDSSGNLNWAKSFGGPLSEQTTSLAVDDSGNVYATGSFVGTIDFDPDTGTYNLSSVGSADIFITKLDVSGKFIWAKSMGSLSIDVGLSTFVTASKNIFLTGYFEDTADFDPGLDTFNIISTGKFDAFVLKLADYNTTLLSGSILTETGVAVPGVSMDITGSENGSIQAASDGKYSFNVRQGGTYTITPSKFNDSIANNGVTLMDVLLMRRHILGTPLSSPYKIIAAAECNADGDTTISTQDILFTRSLILGNITAFPTNRLWQFVSSDYVFPDSNHPFPFPSTRTYTNITTNQTNQNFIGIKLGDVNGSWDGNVP